jgi:putative endonuclease
LGGKGDSRGCAAGRTCTGLGPKPVHLKGGERPPLQNPGAATTLVIAGLDPAIHHFGMNFWIYILASRPNGTLYVGVTNNLIRRVHEHREGLVDGFTKKYQVKSLVYYESHDTALSAIQREKNIKH